MWLWSGVYFDLGGLVPACKYAQISQYSSSTAGPVVSGCRHPSARTKSRCSSVGLTSEAARLSPWQPAALQAARQCARPRNTTKTTTHIGNYAHSYTIKTYQKRKDIYIHPNSVTQLINKRHACLKSLYSNKVLLVICLIYVKQLWEIFISC